MAIETAAPRSRRALLAASLGGLAALAAQALGRPLPTRAANGDPVTVGGTLSGTAITKIANSTNSNTVFWGASSSGVGVYGTSSSSSGVRGESSGGRGVYGLSGGDTGVFGESSAVGVYGTSSGIGENGVGVYGYSNSAYGVLGQSGSFTGVYGISTSGVGVVGESSAVTGVEGTATSGVGVSGTSSSSYGVYGTSSSLYGVYGISTSSYGVLGRSLAPDRPAIVGRSNGDNTGILGYSGSGAVPTSPTKTGVFGYAVQDAASRGVTGRTTEGRGVNGMATTGRGVYGYASSGVGVYATCGTGGTALQAQGPVHFSSAGLAAIASGTSDVTVTPGIDLGSGTKVLVTLMGNPGSTATVVHRVAVHPLADSFTVYLTGTATGDTRVAWFVIS